MSTNSTAGATAPSPYLEAPSIAAVILPVLAFVAIVLDTPCLVWHIGSRNIAASTLVGWVIFQNVTTLVDALLWPTDDTSSWWLGQGYCDVTVKLDFAAGSAIGGAALCIMRSLAKALDTSNPIVSQSRARQIRHNLCVFALTIGLPLYSMVAAWIVQPNRYFILAISGCMMSEWKSWLMVWLCYMPLVALMLATCFYAFLVMLRLYYYQRNLGRVLASTQSGLSRSRFWRLFGLSLSLVLIYLPLFIYIIWTDIGDGLWAFDWNIVHNPETFNTIILVQSFGQVSIERWVRVTLGFVVFACFGFGKDIKNILVRAFKFLSPTRLQPFFQASRNFVSRKHPFRTLSSGNSTSRTSTASGSLTGRAKRMLSKLSTASSVSKRDTVTTAATTSTSPPSPTVHSTPIITSATKTPISEDITALPTFCTLPSSSNDRATSRLERELFELDAEVGDHVEADITTASIHHHHGHDEEEEEEVGPIIPQQQQEQSPPPSYRQSSFDAQARQMQADGLELARPVVTPVAVVQQQQQEDQGHATFGRRGFWSRFNTYAQNASPRPVRPGFWGGSMHLIAGYGFGVRPDNGYVYGRGMAGGENGGAVELNDFANYRMREYENYVVGRLC